MRTDADNETNGQIFEILRMYLKNEKYQNIDNGQKSPIQGKLYSCTIIRPCTRYVYGRLGKAFSSPYAGHGSTLRSGGKLHSFLIRHWNVVIGQLHAPVLLLPGERVPRTLLLEG